MSRREVAQKCFEAKSPEVAVARLSRWINTDPQFLAELKASGYRPRVRFFSPRQVLILKKYIL